jgi:hypothetical protein
MTMLAITWIDTAEGRRWTVVRGVTMLLAGIILHSVGWLGFPPVSWLGKGLLVLGALCIAWAFLHPGRGLPLPLSAACQLQKHGECLGPAATDEQPRCMCTCHLDDERVGLLRKATHHVPPGSSLP